MSRLHKYSYNVYIEKMRNIKIKKKRNIEIKKISNLSDLVKSTRIKMHQNSSIIRWIQSTNLLNSNSKPQIPYASKILAKIKHTKSIKKNIQVLMDNNSNIKGIIPKSSLIPKFKATFANKLSKVKHISSFAHLDCSMKWKTS